MVYAQIRTKNATTIEGIYSINTLSGRIKPLIEDTLSLFIATESKIITIAKYIYDSTGFRINKYNLNEKYLTKKKSQFLCSMDITVNDWELLNDSLLALSGQHIDTLVNRVYLLNLNTGKFSKIAEKAASRSFLKLLSFENKLLIYQSTATIPDAKHMLWYKIFDHNGNCFLNTNDTILLSDQNMAFFGKGLYANNQIFLPGISSDSSTSIVVITTNPSLKIKNTIPSTTSIYKVAQGQLDERNIPIIGYNYYKNPTAFYLLFLDSQKEAIRSCRLIE